MNIYDTDFDETLTFQQSINEYHAHGSLHYLSQSGNGHSTDRTQDATRNINRVQINDENNTLNYSKDGDNLSENLHHKTSNLRQYFEN